MIELSTQQEQRLNALMIAGGYRSMDELLNMMLADFEYQQQLRALRREIDRGLTSGEALPVSDVGQFFADIRAEVESTAVQRG